MILRNYFKTVFTFLFLIILLAQCEEAPIEPINIRPDLIQVTIVSPLDGSIIYDPLVVSVEVESKNPITQVNFYIDNKIIGADTEPPYSIAPDITPLADNAAHIIKCSAEDNFHNVNSGKITITISDQVKSNITLLEPMQNDTIRNDNRVNFKWHHDPTKKFKIQIAKDASFNDIIQSDSTYQTSFTSTQLEQGSYYWRVGYYLEKIYNIFWSGLRRFTIDGPRAPNFVSHQDEEIKKFNIENSFMWNKSEYSVQYQFQLSDYNTGEIIHEELLNDTIITKNLEMNVYRIKARAKNRLEIWGAWSTEITFSNGLFNKEFNLPNELHIVGCLELPDSGFVVASYSDINKYTKLMKVNALCDEEFNSTISNFMISEFSQTPDNNIVMVGNNSNYSSKVVKVDQSFNTMWEYEPINNDKIYLTNVTVAQSGENLLIGLYNEDYVTFENQIYYSAISNSGAPLLERLVGDPRSVGYKIEEIGNGYLIMATYTDTIFGSEAIYNLVVDGEGMIQSEYKFLEFQGFPGQNYQIRDGVRIGNDIYCVGNFGTRYGAFVHKSDIFGIEHWKLNLTNAVPSSAEKCIPTTEGNLVIGGDEEKLFLFKVSPSGNIIWEFDNAYEYTYCLDLLHTFDGGIVLVTGSSLATGTVRLIKLNSDGVTYIK